MFNVIASVVSNLFLWLWLLGLIFLWWATKKNRQARRWGMLLFIGIWLLGTRPVAEAILWPLESRYFPPEIASLQKQRVSQVVVLTGGGHPIRGEILSSAFPHASMYRFLGGLELCSRLGPDCRVIFSGSAGRGRDLPTALTMKDLSEMLSSERQVLAEARSDSTSEHPVNIKGFVGKEPFLLVTSAAHMPRSIKSFLKAGMNPIPYPVDYFTRGWHGWMDWLPSIESLWEISVAFREYEALLFYAIRES
jgi:uncharacterized SAM-binding protein YcdF (DUF218 family)